MNENLLRISILQVIQKGEFFGRQTVYNEIKTWGSFIALKESEYAPIFNDLLQNECIVSKNHPNLNEYAVNPSKDCLQYYNDLMDKANKEENAAAKVITLQTENLKLQNELIPLQKKELKNKILYTAIGAILVYTLEHLQDALTLIQRLLR